MATSEAIVALVVGNEIVVTKIGRKHFVRTYAFVSCLIILIY
jgi:hypothetical protein